MTRVCHFTSVHKTTDIRIFYKECTSLAEVGYETYLVGPGQSRFENGVHVVGLGEPPAGRMLRMTKFAKKIYNAAIEIDADIYHFHDPELLPYGWKLKKLGKTVIFDSHEFYGEQLKTKSYIPSFLRSIVSTIYRSYETYITKRIDAVITVCTLNGKDYFENRAKRSVQVGNFPSFQELLGNISPQNKVYDVIYIGSLTEARGITHLIDAVYLAGGKLCLARPWSSEKYSEELKRKESFRCVTYHGVIPYVKVIKLIRQSRIGASTLLNKGQYDQIDTLPTKVYEYASQKVPTILSEYDYSKRVNEKYRFGLTVNPNDVQEVAQGINRLLVDETLRDELGQNSYEMVRDHFNWQSEQHKLLTLYMEIAEPTKVHK